MMLALFAGCGESASTQQPAAAQTEAPAGRPMRMHFPNSTT